MPHRFTVQQYVELSRHVAEDASLVCGPISLAAGTDHATNPVVLVDVLSESTRDYDEGEKLDRYKKIASVRDILHVDQDTMTIVHHVRREDGGWSSSRHTDPDEVIALSGVDAKLRVGDVYQGAFDLPG